MVKDRTNIRIYGDDESVVAVADLGVTGPTVANIEAKVLPTGFVGLGWDSEDGVDLNRDETVNDFSAWQGGAIVRSKRTAVKDSFHVICLEETATTLGLYYAGVEGEDVTVADDIATTKYAITNQSKSDPRAWLAYFVDGGYWKALVAPNGEVTGRAAIAHKNTDMTVLDLTVTIYGDYDIYTIAPA